MEVLTRGVKYNIEFRAADICNIQVINNKIFITCNVDKLSTIDKSKVCNIFKSYGINSNNYITLLIDINKHGAIDVNKSRLVVKEYLMKGNVSYNSSIKCKLNTAEKCYIISLFMPSYRWSAYTKTFYK